MGDTLKHFARESGGFSGDLQEGHQGSHGSWFTWRFRRFPYPSMIHFLGDLSGNIKGKQDVCCRLLTSLPTPPNPQASPFSSDRNATLRNFTSPKPGLRISTSICHSAWHRSWEMWKQDIFLLRVMEFDVLKFCSVTITQV